ncbi:alpha/beta-hydrolase [Microstroma glucosiphilum]|uniref:Prolyl endopeptidase n=1 Tax=Pseudomicrostroma glucosiphilum TaxID=1684307 RepID=A0A316U262_9BASI|nr:alpha/beta-hydrolase [Pseudomicrostroma glucosiphilum]PWN18571.1 alpha/beta-hydrolase [Pseudomicrostroma glucosiphilum]
MAAPLISPSQASALPWGETPLPKNYPDRPNPFKTIGIPDPWRVLEDYGSKVTKRFVAEQNALTAPRLQQHPSRARLETAVSRSQAYRKISCPQLQADGYYYWLHWGEEGERGVMVRSRNVAEDFGKAPGSSHHKLTARPQLVFDPAQEGQHTSLYDHSFSPCGTRWCAVLQDGGSDWQRLHTIDMSSGQPESIGQDVEHSKFTFGATFLSEDEFLYKRALQTDCPSRPGEGVPAKPDGDFGLFYHHLGNEARADSVILGISGRIVGKPVLCQSLMNTNDRARRRQWLFVDWYANTNPETESFLIELPSEKKGHLKAASLATIVETGKRWLSRGFLGLTTYIGSSDTCHIFLSTCDGHTKGRIVSVDFDALDATALDSQIPYHELIPSTEDTLQSANLVGSHAGSQVLVLVYLQHASSVLAFHDARTGTRLADLPGNLIPACADISQISSRADADDFYIAIQSLTAPPQVLIGKMDQEQHITLATLADQTSFADDYVHVQLPEEALVCTKHFYKSFDGIQIPLFLCHRTDLDLQTYRHPTLLHAYGGFAQPLLPFYDPLFVTWMLECRGIVSLACIRGGGEYGKAWHEAARGPGRRPTSYKDLLYAAKFLQEELSVTTPALTASYGSSNGGTLVATTMNSSPELFGAVLCDVGVHDISRFHLFTMGRLWKGEYGDPDVPADLELMLEWSPLHTVPKQGTVRQPAVLITTADHDVRVIAGHSLKLLAELQSNRRLGGEDGLALGRIYTNTGHESGAKSRHQIMEEAVDRLVFLVSSLPGPLPAAATASAVKGCVIC